LSVEEVEYESSIIRLAFGRLLGKRSGTFSSYLNDKRNYGSLPERLRPPPELKVNDVDPGVLTTFASLLLRDLLDRFNGDVSLAVAAYNGGPGNPNMRYEEGVRTVATHVRGVLERAAMLNGESVMQRSWIRPY